MEVIYILMERINRERLRIREMEGQMIEKDP